MIHYQKGLAGLFVLCQFAGTSWPYGILPGLLSAVLGYILGSIDDLDVLVRDKAEFIDNPYPFQLFAYLVGFVIVFRTNFAYQRYWEGIDAVQRMGAKWLDGACMAVAFDAPGDASQPFLGHTIKPLPAENREEENKDAAFLAGDTTQEDAVQREKSSTDTPAMLSHREFFAETCHLFSLLHALSLQHLRCDNDLDNLQVLTAGEEDQLRLTSFNQGKPENDVAVSKRLGSMLGSQSVAQMHQLLKLSLLGELVEEERLALERDSNGIQIDTVARVTMVEGWIMRRLISRQKHDKCDMGKTSPPILSRLYQVISDGHLAFSQACKTAETPFPFPYHNLIRVFLWLFVLTVPFVINAKILHVPARFVLNFITVGAYFALCQVGDNLEDPYIPYDPNELPLVSIQHHYNTKLLSFGIVPSLRMPEDGAVSE